MASNWFLGRKELICLCGVVRVQKWTNFKTLSRFPNLTNYWIHIQGSFLMFFLSFSGSNPKYKTFNVEFDGNLHCVVIGKVEFGYREKSLYVADFGTFVLPRFVGINFIQFLLTWIGHLKNKASDWLLEE